MKKIAIVFNPSGQIHSMFTFNNDEELQILNKSLYDFPFLISVVDKVNDISDVIVVEKDLDKIKISDDKTSVDLLLDSEIITLEDNTIVCTESKFNKYFSK